MDPRLSMVIRSCGEKFRIWEGVRFRQGDLFPLLNLVWIRLSEALNARALYCDSRGIILDSMPQIAQRELCLA